MKRDPLVGATFTIGPPKRGKPRKVEILTGALRTATEVRRAGYQIDGFTIISLSLYPVDLERLDRLAKSRGGGRSALIREALLRLDLELKHERQDRGQHPIGERAAVGDDKDHE